jgi:hypothetical protein
MAPNSWATHICYSHSSMKLSRHAHAFAATCIPLPSSAHSYSNSVGLPPKQRTGPTRHARGPTVLLRGRARTTVWGASMQKVGGRLFNCWKLLRATYNYVSSVYMYDPRSIRHTFTRLNSLHECSDRHHYFFLCRTSNLLLRQ